MFIHYWKVFSRDLNQMDDTVQTILKKNVFNFEAYNGHKYSIEGSNKKIKDMIQNGCLDDSEMSIYEINRGFVIIIVIDHDKDRQSILIVGPLDECDNDSIIKKIINSPYLSEPD